MFRRFLFIVLVAASASSVSATTILFSSSAGGRTAVDASFTPLPNGNLFLVGSFSSVANITMSGSASAVLASGGWTQFDGTRLTASIEGNPGKLTGQAQDNSAAAAAFNLQNLYVVVFNNATASSATQMGIFRAPTATLGGSWVFPTYDGGALDSLTISMNESSMAAVGGIGSVSNAPSRFILSTLVPEPTAFTLFTPGIIGLLGYRRLRQRA